MKRADIIDIALSGDPLTFDEGFWIWNNMETALLISIANKIRYQHHPEKIVTWIIDRNVNISNVCHAGCQFCNFHCSRNSKNAYITTIEQYREKIDVLKSLGGDQLLLQGGLHPDLGLDFYVNLFISLKEIYPELKLHALGPPEIVHLAKMEGCTYKEVLKELTTAGLSSLPGAGAEILSDRVRKKLSPGKCNTDEWLDVMRVAHQMNITTSATMMFGHIETIEERINHLILIREVQDEKPIESPGFISFIPWPFQDKNTKLLNVGGVHNNTTPNEYLRLFAISRLMLNNIPNLQPSWLTIGIPIGQLCLHAGGNDFGSIMIEENVVSMAGAKYKTDSKGIVAAIEEAGFSAKRRDQNYKIID